MAPPDELVDLVGVAGAGLDVLAHDRGHADYDVVMLKVTLKMLRKPARQLKTSRNKKSIMASEIEEVN